MATEISVDNQQIEEATMHGPPSCKRVKVDAVLDSCTGCESEKASETAPEVCNSELPKETVEKTQGEKDDMESSDVEGEKESPDAESSDVKETEAPETKPVVECAAE